MAQPHVINALMEKRVELAGLVEFHRKEISRIGIDLANVSATIKIFARTSISRASASSASVFAPARRAALNTSSRAKAIPSYLTCYGWRRSRRRSPCWQRSPLKERDWKIRKNCACRFSALCRGPCTASRVGDLWLKLGKIGTASRHSGNWFKPQAVPRLAYSPASNRGTFSPVLFAQCMQALGGQVSEVK